VPRIHLPRPTLALVAAVMVLGPMAPAAPAGADESTRTVSAPAIVPFEDWAPSSCPAPTGADVTVTQRVVVHHSHHPTAATRDQVRPALAEMCRIHLARGFDTIGYHYVVDPWGTVWQARGRLPDADGRAPTAQPEGAHVQGSNPGTAGVVFLGDHESAPPTAAAVDAAVHLMAWLVEATGRDPGQLVTIESTGAGTSLHEGSVDVEVLAGHSATNATLCPGEHLIALLEPIRDRVRTTITGPVAPRGVLVISDVVRPAPDAVAHLAMPGPIYAAPPAEPPLDRELAALGAPGRALLLAGLVLTVARRRRPAASVSTDAGDAGS